MNYREKIRKAIECPQFGYATYGEWGALKLEQRIYIKRLLDELDSADNYIKRLYFENQKYKEVLDKLKECIKNFLCTEEYINVNGIAIADNYAEVLEILKEVE